MLISSGNSKTQSDVTQFIMYCTNGIVNYLDIEL